jgi:hypothetical protein
MKKSAAFLMSLKRSEEIDVTDMLFIVEEIRARLDRAAAWAKDGRRKRPGHRAMLDDVLVYLQMHDRLTGVRAMIAKQEGSAGVVSRGASCSL